jgi:2-polyprenyl-3-methyl-5-hydroxy-6-metoxy-1,4-benzoquinol methylase
MRGKPVVTQPADDRPSPACWCGNARLAPFSPHYLRCDACQTLVAIRRPAGDVTQVGADEQGLYGKDYWFEHQEQDVGLPNIRKRVRSDLPERCVHWLRTVLKYKLPPARVQELGSAHGALVALLNWAGYEATGLELSPWIVDFARQTFDVPTLQGPLEDQGIDPESLDVIALMDVLEHLPDPVGTMSHGMKLLNDGGIFVVQTPAYPEGTSYEELVARDDYFLNHMRDKHEEHLFLLSRTAARELFRRIGCNAFEFEPAIFPQYDMYFVAGGAHLHPHGPEAIAAAVGVSPSGRFIQALLDATAQRDDYLFEANRRLEVIEGLVKEIERLRKLAGES